MNMRDLLEQRSRTAAAMREIVEHPEENGDLSDDQQGKFDALKDELGKVEKRIERQAIIDEADRRMAGTPLTEGSGDDRFDAQCRGFSLQRAIASQIEARSVDAGREIEVSQELARRSGRSAQGIFVPLNALVERRVQLTSGDAGQLVGTDFLADQFIDALRPSSVVGALGARMFTGLRGDIAIPKMDDLTPAAEWIAENAALTSADHSFDQVTGTVHHVGLLTEWSRKMMLQSSPAIEQLVRADFTQKLAAAVDLAALKGQGGVSAEPEGIAVNIAVGTATGLADYADVVNVVAEVEAADVPMASLGWAGNAWVKAKMKTTLRTSADTSSSFIMGDDNTLGGYPYRTTSQLTGNPGASPPTNGETIFGSWPQAILAFWGDAGADVLVNPYAATPYAKGNVQIRAFVDADVLIRHAAAFVYVSAITVT